MCIHTIHTGYIISNTGSAERGKAPFHALFGLARSLHFSCPYPNGKSEVRRKRMEGVKIYGLCLERLRHQITKAKERTEREASPEVREVLLECYNTGELDDIIDILELYDVSDRAFPEVHEKLEELAYTVSELSRERITFGYTDEGYLGLYLVLNREVCEPAILEALAA
jgi:hypothetical protein